MTREQDLKDLYLLVKKPAGSPPRLSPKLKELLEKYTKWSELGTQQKSAIRRTLAAGASLDLEGKLVINNQGARQAVISSTVANILFSHQDLISTKTKNPDSLFNAVERGRSKIKRPQWHGPRARSARAVRGMTGRWPRKRR